MRPEFMSARLGLKSKRKTMTNSYWFCPWCYATYSAATHPCASCGLDGTVPAQSELTLEEFGRILANWDRHGEVRAASVERWITMLGYSVQELTGKRENAAYGDVIMFWIKLHGAMVDLPRSFDTLAETVTPKFPSKWSPRTISVAASGMLERRSC